MVNILSERDIFGTYFPKSRFVINWPGLGTLYRNVCKTTTGLVVTPVTTCPGYVSRVLKPARANGYDCINDTFMWGFNLRDMPLKGYAFWGYAFKGA